ncbi:hypothetical protein POM88_029044 [Heracleum sosnowskyi]|uniref:Uncharacterized protein n=1 Tax=Heracleum sosnowskyi TaxID=360622 RepID=A0AAD8HU07_9APIA|nr:hypothetical protein POM88_029044 [Heracleum sosnowskyi]
MKSLGIGLLILNSAIGIFSTVGQYVVLAYLIQQLHCWRRVMSKLDRFLHCWTEESQKEKPWLLCALNRSLGRRFWFGGFYKIGNDLSQFVGPVILNHLLQDVTHVQENGRHQTTINDFTGCRVALNKMGSLVIWRAAFSGWGSEVQWLWSLST